MEAKTKDLWVVVETKEDGSAKNVGYGAAQPPAGTLADKQGGSSWWPLVMGCGRGRLSRKETHRPRRGSGAVGGRR